MPREDLTELIGYDFGRSELLAEALTHSSVLPQLNQGRRRTKRTKPPANYERLEFLGDRVLGLIVADLLWRRFPTEPEGPLTRRHAQLVRRDTLAQVAATIGLDNYLKLSPAETASGAARNPTILADSCEAVIAAIYLDGGYAAAFAFVERFWTPLLDQMEGPPFEPKSMLQEWAEGRGLPLPEYELLATDGPAHALRFTVAARVAGFNEATGTASSKRGAETDAAAALLERLPSGAPRKPRNGKQKKRRR